MEPITFRPFTEADLDFLREVYASTRAEELAMVPWTEEQKAAFCRQQFDAQHTHYQKYYPTASYDIIEQAGRGIGRLYVERKEREILVIDITLLPAYRGAGLGTRMLRELQEEAREARKTLLIHVEKFNPALRLYQRLGFRATEDKEVYLLMEWRGGNDE